MKIAAIAPLFTPLIVLAAFGACGAGVMAATCLDGEACQTRHASKFYFGAVVLVVSVLGRVICMVFDRIVDAPYEAGDTDACR